MPYHVYLLDNILLLVLSLNEVHNTKVTTTNLPDDSIWRKLELG